MNISPIRGFCFVDLRIFPRIIDILVLLVGKYSAKAQHKSSKHMISENNLPNSIISGYSCWFSIVLPFGNLT